MGPSRGRGRVAFPATLVVTMMASAYQIFVFAVLASHLIDEFGLSRAELGLIGSVNTLVGAATAPLTGRLTDRIGARQSVVLVLVVSAVGMGAMAAAPNAWWLAAAALIGGVPQGWGNPATNTLISSRVPAGRRGSVTGIKQSGVTLGVFLAGATMPALANISSWRGSVATFAVLFVALAIAVELTLAADPERTELSADGSSTPIARFDPIIWRLTLYALLMGTVGGAVGRFFPLFAEEAIGFSTEAAGMVLAISGLLGMGARVWVGRLAEHRIAPTRLLGHLALVGAAYCVLLAVVRPATGGVLWLSPPLNAVGIAAWNAVAMLAIITYVATSQSGRASGIVMLGFLGGLTIGGPAAGLAVDLWDDYSIVWWAATGLALVSAVLMWLDPAGRRTDPSGATTQTVRSTP